ncbi:hypothetical protein A2W45_02545 [Candidatus Curtissbacteria bacterium RIFCSPHIGHO2_12_41_11]|uniref:Uncharacterized protein n=3 Tax=Candidatus Curtissiibacteriota TaxID=1752717 RepID=A0A1F5HR37_9BACT|nr:MAG: hypothetical protein UU56_C0003G0068 [Candidatus Curtissbacteria bacterium GW2011_GWA2_41_24]OGD88436.1 MAG: hypothetical protein A2Z54_02225 [Candidatus Curtissbacteria bacterium RIFCSPHIGHO2_02_39_8]OGD99965.1 MAG: hypothetical protein A2W45_02545 [Candidatus Curtissbacteria bacterium RIFCSPHIGHO2_12_41_11]OGE06604.1 MAG: hypothetical protein A2W70_04040 [Candidatus Curtissbacteria bacterium RIFCSPLOWO2_02_41_11]
MERRVEYLKDLPSEEMIIGFTTSKDGRPCIGMVFNNTEWVFLTTKSAILADQLRKTFAKMQVETITGPAFDWRTSIEKQRLILVQENGRKVNKPVGIFVPADKFDWLATTYTLL